MRSEFRAKVRRAAIERCAGKCEECDAALAETGVEFDHIIPDGLGGMASLENCQCLCPKCHRVKTSKEDVPRIAKAKRVHRKHNGDWKPRGRPIAGSKRSGWKVKLNAPPERRDRE